MGTNEENKILEWSKARMSSSDTHHWLTSMICQKQNSNHTKLM
jgi:hypothetical protein